jgi:ribonucleoside-diphosphate reductase alpha chain
MPHKPADELPYGSPEWFKAITATLTLDPQIAAFNVVDDPLIEMVRQDKYYQKGETCWNDVALRVSTAVFEKDTEKHRILATTAMELGLWMPGGRILAGAGSGKRVTLMNCYVNETIVDSMDGIITRGLSNIAKTQQQGGGIGTDFSTIRPPDALVQSLGTPASGPEPFIDSYYAVGTTVASAGMRRQAQMGTLCDTHPWLPQFITAKQTAGKWTGFNVSVLVSDAFMAAVEDDEDWLLYFHIPPCSRREEEVEELDFVDDAGVKQYVYSVWKARALWDRIIQGTYDYAEPGVIFIDRVNDLNNLKYCETIRCTNPCGEQPLPPNGTCNLGAVNLSRMVRDPFTEDAEFDWELLQATVAIGTRFLDNVIDVTNYPLPAQEAEEIAKRRIGLGVSGLANAMALLGIRYGSAAGAKFAERVMRTICFASYRTSAELAVERGAFPLFTKEWGVDAFAEERLPTELWEKIQETGIRNGVLLTIAPTGTTSIAYGNISSGLEPVFLFHAKRRVRQKDYHTYATFDSYDWGAKFWLHLNPGSTVEELPSYMVTADSVRIHEHLRIQEVMQHWVDASISKTINLPTDVSYEEFKSVYSIAYESGCKGCTTYRPSDIRGSILSAPGEDSAALGAGSGMPMSRPPILSGQTIQLKWPGLKSSVYLCLNTLGGAPYEVFLMAKDQTHNAWTTTVTLLMSRLLREGKSIVDLCAELKNIESGEGAWAEGKYHPSLVSFMGVKLLELWESIQEDTPADLSSIVSGALDGSPIISVSPSTTKPSLKCGNVSCGSYDMRSSEGCPTCNECGWSKCS